MKYLEKLVNEKAQKDLFRTILRGYFSKFMYQSVTYEDFKSEIDFPNKYENMTKDYFNQFNENSLPENFTEIFIGWEREVRNLFMTLIFDDDKELTDEQYNYLTNVLNLKEGYNKVINCSLILFSRVFALFNIII